ncbi:Zinc-ribbon containing domain-containing protein [Paenibacillus sp. UNC496MF]|uniref:YgzB family protein n=1 Tax=Paenibacillus sp. UNC496MF TaxID=1502753 RepID=UPI0008E0805D|nr:YgzB family protein [Paenibacillus sp. UNC496MF]SFJ45837.1 Zinc-ribbon containing domain-containing protein [Paenibacillus sp. UNC496MF]
MFGKSSKINEFRLWGLLFTLFGMGLMILGTAGIVFWGQAGKVFAAIFMVIGMIAMLVSVAVYFWAGMLSTSATILICPECNRHTKILGKTDRCMYCKTKLTLDPKQATDLGDDESAAEEVGQPQT